MQVLEWLKSHAMKCTDTVLKGIWPEHCILSSQVSDRSYRVR